MTQSYEHVDALTVKSWLDAGEAVLIDIREKDEVARERIPGAHNLPGSTLTADQLRIFEGKKVVLHCASGMRSARAEPIVKQAGLSDARHMEGGIGAWRAAGLPLERNAKAPIPIMRQVQIVAGSLVLTGCVLGLLVNPGFYGLSAFIGAGLVFSGVSGTCAMGSLLQMMPWNKVSA